jgi:hypothetical protein
MMRKLGSLLLLSVLVGCAVIYSRVLDERYGSADPARYDRPVPPHATLDYRRDVKPILDNRCVVCHGCYDAPCQLNLASYEGTTRGASKERVYDAARLLAAQPSRMFFDAHSNAAWRKRGFQPVLNERAVTAEANREGSVLYRSLRLKRLHPLPPGALLPRDQIDVSLDRAQQCPAIEEMDRFEEKYPQWGMPFGLPALSAREHAVLAGWIEAGAPTREAEPLTGAYGQRIAQWEAFLNGDSLKHRLMSRYIYEHWFVGHLYFDDLPGQEYFQLVRSKTPPGRPIELIATRRPYDDPGVARVYYRLRRVFETPLAKTLMPYALHATRMARIREWFLDAPYQVTALPSYAPETASNPFVTFEQLPVNARYRFMLEEAQFILMGFIKGPVCRGQMAVDVINDRFWAIFVSPEAEEAIDEAGFLAREAKNLQLPAENESTTGLLRWRRYAKLEAEFLEAKSRHLTQRFGAGNPPRLNVVWDGARRNPNAALTVFRHFDSATVVQGLVGEQPQTVMLMGYPLFERIHYLLVAGYDVYGNVGHQLQTRLYFDFMRMEGELNFLALLPRVARNAVRDRWYRDADKNHIQQFRDVESFFAPETGIAYRSADPLAELYAMVRSYLAPVAAPRYALAGSGLSGATVRNLEALSALRGRSTSHLPEVSFLTVEEDSGRLAHFSLVANRAHSNVAELFDEAERRLPDEDDLTLVHGFLGAYPNAFFSIRAGDLPAFVDAVRRLASEQDYGALLARYGVRRTEPRFWAHSDELHAAYRRAAPREAGLFDYNRFENR